LVTLGVAFDLAALLPDACAGDVFAPFIEDVFAAFAAVFAGLAVFEDWDVWVVCAGAEAPPPADDLRDAAVFFVVGDFERDADFLAGAIG
jgi:hypothetical protein